MPTVLLKDMARGTTQPKIGFEDHPLCEEESEGQDEEAGIGN